MVNNISSAKMLSEFLGTFILATSIEFITVYDLGTQISSLFAILAGFFIAITLSREISGGHINPGVTVTVYLSEEQANIKDEISSSLWMYIIAQASGAISAALIGLMIYNENIFKLAPSPRSTGLEILVLEIIGSTVFYSLILIQGDKDARLNNDKTISTLSITAGLAAGIAFSGNISGACLNPALGFAFNFSRLLITGNMDECKFLWAYVLGPFTASYLASYFYLNVYRKYFIIENSDEKIKPLMEYNCYEKM